MRNKHIFEHKSMPPEVVMEWAKKNIIEWQEANKRHMQVLNERGDNKEFDRNWTASTGLR